MKVTFYLNGGYATFVRETTDPKFYGTRSAKGEHALLHFIMQWLNARGFDLIKTRLQKDGHLMGDQFQPYLRSRQGTYGSAAHVYLVSGFYQIRGANEDWNQGEVTLQLHGNVFDVRGRTDHVFDSFAHAVGDFKPGADVHVDLDHELPLVHLGKHFLFQGAEDEEGAAAYRENGAEN